MGSGSSQPKPQQTQSAPATARSTPKPRRNQQFQEVQVTQAGGNPKPRGTPRGGQGQTAQAGQVAGQGASPKPHQSTSNPATRPAGQRGQDPGASGSSTDRSSRPQQQQRGAAANPRGGQRQTAMAGQQQPPSMSFDELMKSAKDEGPPRMSYEELKKTSKTSKDPTNPSNDIAQKDERNARTDEVVAANGSSGANNSSNVAAQMGNDMEKSQKGVPAKAHVTGKAGNAPGKKKPSLIVVKPSKPTAETTDKLKQVGKDKKGTDGDRKDSKVATDRAKHDDTTEGKQGSKTGPILQRSKIFRSGLKDIKEENEEEKSGQTKLAQNKTGTSQVKQTMQRKPVVKGFGQAGSKSNADANKTESAESKSKANDNKTETNTNKTENKAHPGSEKGKNRIGGSIDKENQSEKIGLEKSNGVDTHNEQSNDIDKVKKAGKQTDGSSIKPGSKGAGSVKDKGATNSDEHYSETGQSKQASHNQIPKGIADISDKPESSVKTQDTKVNSGEINSGKSNKSVSKVNQGDKAEINGASNSFGKNIGNSNNKDDKNKSRSTNKPTDMNKSEVGTNKTANEHQEPTDSKSNKLTNGTVSSSSTQNMGKVDGLHENNQTKSQLENENKNMKNEITDAKATTSNDDEKLNQNEITTTKTNTQNKDDDYDKGKSKAKKKVVDEQGFINYEILDKVTDQIQKIQEETETGENLSQLSYDNFYDGKEEDIGTAADLSHEPKAEDAEESEAAGASKADNGDPEVLSMDMSDSKEDDIVFETFYHRSGKEFQCIYQSGMRFYLDDWGSKEWQPFPKRWYNEGLLVTNTILREDGTEQARGADQSGAGASGQGGSGQGQSRSQGRSQGQGGSGGSDDREGFIMHPTRGRVPTYIFYKKHNVHMYFDKETGSWVRLPIGWELHHDMVKSLVDQVEEAVPTWGDRHDILALLRACNYDPDECISIYLHLEKDEWMKVARTAKEAKGMDDKENKIAELEKKNRELEIELQKERQRREELERNLDDQTNKMSEIEAESKQTEAQMSAMTGGRPKSARPISVMRMAGKGGKPGAKGGRPPTKQGEVVNPDDVLDLNANAKELRKAHVKLKAEVERYFGDFKHIVGQVGPAIKKLKQSEKGTQNEIEEVRALYRKEALQRKLLYNQLQELRGNIRVFCRVRKDDKADPCLKFPSDQDIQCIHPQQGKKMFNFDKIFDPTSTQEAVFDDTKPIITSCADGYNVCLLAYGQTGSGKTFTMMGPESNPGINIRAMKELFKVCSERKETMTYKLTVSLVEIYNETLQDLLTSDAKALDLRTAGNKVVIPGLTEHEIKTVDDVKKIMSMGDKNRSVASTKMNSTSSRSHLVLMLAVEGNDKVTNAVTRGTLVLCDLAGSERISKTEAEGQRLVEAAAINKSLSALGQVFTALRTSQLHVPYRNSKLTQILQPSLGGDAKACLFVNVSPDTYNYLETVSTLTFGSNARQVALGQAKQNISKGK